MQLVAGGELQIEIMEIETKRRWPVNGQRHIILV